MASPIFSRTRTKLNLEDLPFDPPPLLEDEDELFAFSEDSEGDDSLIYLPSDPEDLSDLLLSDDPSFSSTAILSCVTAAASATTTTTSTTRDPIISVAEEDSEDKYPWMLSDDDDEAFSAPEHADEEEDSDEEEDNSDENDDVAKEELDNLRSDLQCPGMSPEQVHSVTDLLKAHVRHLVSIMLSAANQEATEPMQMCARLLEDVLATAEQSTELSPWRVIDATAIQRILKDLRNEIVKPCDTAEQRAWRKAKFDGTLKSLDLGPTRDKQNRKPGQLEWQSAEYTLLRLGLDRFMDPEKLNIVPRALRATLLPHRPLEAIERCIDRCGKRARTANEKAVQQWCSNPSGDFSAEDDARLSTAMDMYKGNFALIARLHFPQRSQFQLRHRAAKLNLRVL